MRAAWLAMPLVVANWLVGPNMACATDKSYEGTWHTTNRKLGGTMQCDVKQVASETWKGRFHGVWQGVPFDYTVSFTGPAADVRGTATIDGATYTWTGMLTESTFKGSFTGSRYTGHFDLEDKKATTIRR